MKVYTIFGGQYGSEGKGLAASYIASQMDIDLSVTDAGPNAGHTSYHDGKQIVTFHLPTAGILSPKSKIHLSAGAAIHVPTLEAEIKQIESLGFSIADRLTIHPNAVIITENMRVKENLDNSLSRKISGTLKGVGTAIAGKTDRSAIIARYFPALQKYINDKVVGETLYHPTRNRICVEVAQGFSLGNNQQFYPFCTSRSCTPAQGLMNAGIPTSGWVHVHNIAVIRTNPIRVGSLPGHYSGDFYPDQEETTWEALGLEPQYTTVTKRVRRVFTFSVLQIRDMIMQTLPNTILINFCNQSTPEKVMEIRKAIENIYDELNIARPTLLYGYGPKKEDVMTSYEGIK